MKKILIIHGYGVNANFYWYPWAKKQLEQKGYEVEIPDMPSSLLPKAEQWIEMIMEHVEDPDETILVGHSLGALCVLLYLNIYGGRPFPKVILVGTPLGVVEHEEYKLFKDFLKIAVRELDWENIKAVAKKFVVYHGKHDLIVPYHHGEHLAEFLDVEVKGQNDGHFGGTEFQELLEEF